MVSSVLVTPTTAEPTRAQTSARIVLGLALLAFGLWTVQSFLYALAWAGVFAVALWPLYGLAIRRFGTGRHNLLWPAVFTLGIVLVFLIPLALVIVALSQEARMSVDWMRDAEQHGVAVPGVVARLPVVGGQVAGWWHQNLGDPEGARQLFERLGRGNMVGLSRRLGTQIARRTVTLFFVLLTLFVLFREGDLVVAQMRAASRRVFGPRGEMLGLQIIASIHGTVDGLVLVGLGEGVVIGASYAIAGVPHPVVFGLITGIAAMVPFAGPIVFCLAGLVLFADGSTAAAIGVVAWGFVVNFSSDHFIRPALIGGATKLPFLWVLFGILGGVEVFGLLGLFLGPAVMAALILLWRELVEPQGRADGSPVLTGTP